MEIRIPTEWESFYQIEPTWVQIMILMADLRNVFRVMTLPLGRPLYGFLTSYNNLRERKSILYEILEPKLYISKVQVPPNSKNMNKL